MLTLAWMCAIVGLGLGLALVPVPGLPGSAVALLGLVAFAALTEFEPVGKEALVIAAALAMTGAAGQLLGAPMAGRGLGGGGGAATGAALGAALGVFLPVPGAIMAVAICGAVAGAVLGGGPLTERVRGVSGAAAGCVVAAAWDLLGVLGVGAVLAVADATRSVG